jgi:hypothetical protein
MRKELEMGGQAQETRPARCDKGVGGEKRRGVWRSPEPSSGTLILRRQVTCQAVADAQPVNFPANEGYLYECSAACFLRERQLDFQMDLPYLEERQTAGSRARRLSSPVGHSEGDIQTF